MPYLPSYIVPDHTSAYRPWGEYLQRPTAGAYGASAWSKITSTLGLPSPEDLEGGDTLGLVQEYAPTVAQLIQGLTYREQEAVLKVKIENLQKYAHIPLVGRLAQDRISEYQARLAVLPALIAAEEKKEKSVQLIYTLGAVAVGAIALSALASTIKKLRS